jgi:tetratricopeptide (TPR) repeat protein
MISTKKKLAFTLVTFLVFLSVIVLSELIMEAMAPAPENPLVTEVSYDGIQWYQLNRSYLRKYFSSGDRFVPEFKPALFRKVKTPKTFRIICLGESSMFGVPYQMTTTMPAMLRKQLRHLYPDREIEVINFGASAINSNVIRDFASELLRFEPDLVLIYTGHNEFYGPDGIGASWLEKRFPSLTALKYTTRELRLMTGARNLLRSAMQTTVPPSDFNLMKQVSRKSHVDVASADAVRVLKNFSRNLHAIARIFSDKQIPVILSDITSNLLFPPFASESEGDTSGISSAIALAQQTSDPEDARRISSRFASLLRAHPRHASLLYWRGMLEMAQGNDDAALFYLRSARDHDALAFRAPAAVNDIIHSVAQDLRVPCLPADSLFTSAFADPVAYSGLFWEHLHPSPKGYYTLASLFLQEITSRGLPGKTSVQTLLPFDNDSLSLCWLDLAFGDLSITNLTSKWPFHDYHVTPLVLNSEDEQLRSVVLDVYEQRMVWDAGCYKSAALFAKQNRYREAETTYEAVLEEYPYNFYGHYLLASLLNHQGKHLAAIEHYEQSIASNPRYPFPLLDLGLINVNMGKFDEAIQRFNAALAAIPAGEERALKANIHYGLAAAYANKKDFLAAEQHINEALQIAPDYRDALMLRAQISQFLK